MSVEDLFQAYYDARRNKRNTRNALAFEIDYETKLFQLYDDIMSGRYEIGESTCFISFKPVQREIFAADFRDRVVHHFIYNYISPCFERLFINDAYSCRIGKGTSYGVKRTDHFIRSCSRNYVQDCYVLKLDIRGYFMAMDRSILYRNVASVIQRYQDTIAVDIDLLLRLTRQVIFHDPTKHFRLSGGGRNDWTGLPKSKSLFFTGINKGLPIGNLTSQLFGNVYLNDFDRFVRYRLGCKYYGRYVDDFVIVHRDKRFLKSLIPVLQDYLRRNISLEIHTKKIYLQHGFKGVPFLGATIKPYRKYIGNKTKAGCYQSIMQGNKLLARSRGKPKKEEIRKWIASINSYLGAMQQYDTYRLRYMMITRILDKEWNHYVQIAPKYDKLTAS